MENEKQRIEEFKERYDAFLEKLDKFEYSDHWNKKELGEMDANYGSDIINVAIRLMAADGQFTGKEMLRVNNMFGFDYTAPEIDDIHEDYKEGIDHVIDVEIAENYALLREIDADTAKEYLALINMVGEIVAASDDALADSEKAVIEQLKSIGN